jgi:hypothetical protein
MHVVGGPLAAAVVDRTESMRSCVAMLWRAAIEGDDIGEAVYCTSDT